MQLEERALDAMRRARALGLRMAARAVGIRAIWKRPFDFEGEPDPAPDAEITCLLDLHPILERWTSDT